VAKKSALVAVLDEALYPLRRIAPELAENGPAPGRAGQERLRYWSD
jgi:hypothetical protein